jgi:predicted nucleotidyltransferase
MRDMGQPADQALRRLLADAKDDADILAVILFGSQAHGEARPASDVDVCLVLEPRPRLSIEASRKRLDRSDLDVTSAVGF